MSFWAQFKVKSNFQKYSDVEASSQRTGAETARRILDINGLYDVPVEPVRGTLTDHYDPTERVVRLSEPVYYGRSISAISVASHEVGHALRASGIIRRACAEAQNFSGRQFCLRGCPSAFLGRDAPGRLELNRTRHYFVFGRCFFQLVTLPVEFNASARAKRIIVSEGFIRNSEEHGVNKVLNAAALTYVIAALVSLFESLRFVMIFLNGRDEN